MKVKTTSPVRHDGEDIEVGTVLDIDTPQAQELINAGVAEVPAKSEKSNKGE